MPTSGGPGQQVTPNPIKAMPATRATVMATPVGCGSDKGCLNGYWGTANGMSVMGH